MSTTEQQAEEAILALCRKTPPGGWVMRSAPENPIRGGAWKHRCNVINLSPEGFKPFREIVAGGETWAEVLAVLQAEGE